MNRKRFRFSSLVGAVLIVALTFLFSSAFAADTQNIVPLAATDSPSSVHALLSGLSDEQVRQMLIEELKKEAVEKSSSLLEPELNGPGAPFSNLLRTFDKESAQSDYQFKKLRDGIPNLFPDLYKVFISL